MDFKLACVFCLSLGFCVTGQQNETNTDCFLPAEGGMCYAYFPMFFYDAPSKKCLNFVYGGCGGNANRFWTEKACMDRCAGGEVGGEVGGEGGGVGGEERQTVSEEISTDKTVGSVSEDICNQEKQPGNCSSSINRYYFNKDSGKCEVFKYTGCGKNDNNFVYDFECERACLGARDLGDVCSEKTEQGPCRAYFPRYYFNKETDNCEQFIFGGCAGNHNNFQTKEECKKFCTSPRDLGKSGVCNIEKEEGPCRAYFPRFYFNKSSGQCEKFIFGGCSGNRNNFRRKGECERVCMSRSSPFPLRNIKTEKSIGSLRGALKQLR